jgi:hypothetical protein
MAGKLNWFVPDGYLPTTPPSHESACLLNVGDRDATVRFTFYFEDRDPLGPLELTLGARRTHHVRLDRLDLALPREVPYAYTVESDVPVVLQHSRLDTTDGYTLFTTMGYGE